jgi:hypothetical protein
MTLRRYFSLSLLYTATKNTRVTELYDDYLDAYTDPAPPLPPSKNPTSNSDDRVMAWARSAGDVPPVGISRNGSRSAPGSSYAPSSFGSMRRRASRRRPQRNRMQSAYEDEEEEGYVSGDYDDGFYDLMKIRVKVRIMLTMIFGKRMTCCIDPLQGRCARHGADPGNDVQRIHG